MKYDVKNVLKIFLEIHISIKDSRKTHDEDLFRVRVVVLNLGADGPVAVREVEGPRVDPLVA